MSKVVDITSKLDFETSKTLVIKGKKIFVNADAPTVLRIMGMMDENFSNSDVLKAYELLFSEKAKNILDGLNLSFKDLVTVVTEAMTLVVGEEEELESDDPYYDLIEDWDLIVSSFLSQYGIRLQTREFETVSWDEFKSLLGGIAPDTVLGRVVSIRSETDKDVIKHFSKEQRKIYDDWRNRSAESMTAETFKNEMKNLEMMFAAMCGGGEV